MVSHPPTYQKVADAVNPVLEDVGLPGFIADSDDALQLPQSKEYSLGLDLVGGVRLVYDTDLSGIADTQEQEEALQSLRDVIERRVNQLGVREPVVQLQGSVPDTRLIVELSGIDNPEHAIEEIGKTPLLEFHEVRDFETNEDFYVQAVDAYNQGVRALLAEQQGSEESTDQAQGTEEGESTEAEEQEDSDNTTEQDEEYVDLSADDLYSLCLSPSHDSNPYLFQVRAILQGQGFAADPCFIATDLNGRFLNKASVVPNPLTGSIEIALNFNNEGATLFEEITERSIQKPLAIVLDGEIISSPIVQAKLSGGEATITGVFTLDEAKQLASNLNAGALPVPIHIASQQQIGQTLGEESVSGARQAGILGIVAVFIFMVVVYRLSGLLSVLSLVFYIALLLTVIKVFSITLTLAGIAGIILSIGMAVDANILVFERLREELKEREDTPMRESIRRAFKRTWPAVRDGNFSTIITAIILFFFSTSFVKGFALTLGVGVAISMFSAMVITRYLLELCAVSFLARKKWLWSRILRV